jgi:signal transduction histidine kinase
MTPNEPVGSARERQARRRSEYLVLATIPMLVAVLLGWLLYDGVARAQITTSSMRHTQDVIIQAYRVLSALQDAETGQRGYLLTGDSTYLEPFTRGMNDVESAMTSLRQLTSDNATQGRSLDTLEQLRRAKAAELALTIRLRREQGAARAMGVVRTNTGKRTMDEFRGVIVAVIAEERRLLAIREADDSRRSRVLVAIIIGGALMTALVTLVVNRRLMWQAAQETRLAADLESQNAVLTDQGLELELQAERLQEQANELEMQNEELQEVTSESMERAREAQDARAMAEAANKAKSDFLAVMSHELRTPLNAIAGYAELMQLGVPEPAPKVHQEYLARIQRSQQHLLGLINSVLNFARLESGSVNYVVGDVSVASLLDGVEPLIAPQMAVRGHTYTCEPCDGALMVRADADKVTQILLNLISNAQKFTPPAGRITMSATAIDAGADSLVAFHVTDTGPGIPEDKQRAIFDPFVQLDPERTRRSGGVGLGLAISRELARGMGGELTVDSVVGAGSRFTLTLPRSALGAVAAVSRQPTTR